jgi:hypothetical protein
MNTDLHASNSGHSAADLDDSFLPTTISIDTTEGSILHRLMRKPSGQLRSPLSVYIISLVSTYGAIAATAALTAVLGLDRGYSHRLLFQHDWNVMFMFLVSFPTLVVLIVTDDTTLRKALHRIQVDGVLTFSDVDSVGLVLFEWEGRFRRTNRASYLVGAAVGVLVAALNFKVYTPSSVGFWIAANDRLLPVGYIFLVCIFLFYTIVPVLVVRSVAISLFLRELTRHAHLSMLPAHPDHSGGLGPIGRMGLRNQYALTTCGFNTVLLVIVSYAYLPVPEGLRGLIEAAIIAYVALGPLIFMGPLIPFRQVMVATKVQLLSEVAGRLRVELRRLRNELPAGLITKEDEELVERLRKIGRIIEELPVWPFDSGTLKRFVTAYVTPIVGAIGYVVLKGAVETAVKSLLGIK